MSGSKQENKVNYLNWNDEEVSGSLEKAADDEISRRVFKVATRRLKSLTSVSAANPFNDFGGFSMNSGPMTSTTTSTSFNFLQKFAKASYPPKIMSETTSECFSFETDLSNFASKTKSLNCVYGITSTRLASKTSDMKTQTVQSSAQIEYLGNIKALNIMVVDWIKAHVDENPLCYLTPVFRDYADYLKKFEKRKKKAEEKEKSSKQGPQNEYLLKVKALNSATAARVQKHVDKNPLCNLSSVFKEYASIMKHHRDALQKQLQEVDNKPTTAATSEWSAMLLGEPLISTSMPFQRHKRHPFLEA